MSIKIKLVKFRNKHMNNSIIFKVPKINLMWPLVKKINKLKSYNLNIMKFLL